MVEDPLVKFQYLSKGQNVVFGRTLKGEDYSNLIYIGKILESTKGKELSRCKRLVGYDVSACDLYYRYPW